MIPFWVSVNGELHETVKDENVTCVSVTFIGDPLGSAQKKKEKERRNQKSKNTLNWSKEWQTLIRVGQKKIAS